VPWLVHAYTASSAVLAFLALRAIGASDFRLAFLWLAGTVLVDASDGWLARTWRVRDRLPRIDGSRLDDIVDYLTFVFVPMYLLDRAELLPGSWGGIVAAIALLASAFGFSRDDAKTADHYFTGFPSYWNIVALYMFALQLRPVVNALVIVALSALVFVPVRYIYPSRTPTLRMLTLALGALWGIAMGIVIWQLPRPSPRLVSASLLFPLYYTVVSLVLHVRRERVQMAAR
jgi:phosphatidylcholine synthase